MAQLKKCEIALASQFSLLHRKTFRRKLRLFQIIEQRSGLLCRGVCSMEYATVNPPDSPPFAREFAASVNAITRTPLKTFDFSIETQKVAVDEHLEITRTSRMAANDSLVVLYCDR